jgi:non-specific serine/threonine protein kinase
MELSADEKGLSAEDRRRLQELQGDLDEAETRNDLGHATRLRAERDMLLARLAGETDAHDAEPARARERARINVTRTIKDAIARIREHDGALARHLAHAVHTGAWCSYAPETEVRWAL